MQIGLVLGAGGARGFAHVGALRALEEAHLVPVAIAGTSMGGIIGALAAAGHSSQAITNLVRDRSRLTLPTLGRRGGLLAHEKVIEAFCHDLPEHIEELQIAFAVMAVDIARGEAVRLDRGALQPALAATVAIPGLLSPVRWDERYYVDGGVVNALAVDVIRDMTDAKVVAIDVTPPRDRPISFEANASLWRRIWNRLTFRRRPLTVDLLVKVFDIQQSLLNEHRLRASPPDVYIHIDANPDIRPEDFHRFQEIVDAGYRVTREALKQSSLAQAQLEAAKPSRASTELQ